jgi:hypothetical protein
MVRPKSLAVFWYTPPRLTQHHILIDVARRTPSSANRHPVSTGFLDVSSEQPLVILVVQGNANSFSSLQPIAPLPKIDSRNTVLVYMHVK